MAIGAVIVGAVFVLPIVGLVSRSLRVGDGFSLAAWRGAFGGAGALDVGPSLTASLTTAVVAATLSI
ncbi:MAG: hypothetical protein ACKOYL_12665, partial [Actinomycetota bacterium]